jgi:hypothetical protein
MQRNQVSNKVRSSRPYAACETVCRTYSSRYLVVIVIKSQSQSQGRDRGEERRTYATPRVRLQSRKRSRPGGGNYCSLLTGYATKRVWQLLCIFARRARKLRRYDVIVSRSAYNDVDNSRLRKTNTVKNMISKKIKEAFLQSCLQVLVRNILYIVYNIKWYDGQLNCNNMKFI